MHSGREGSGEGSGKGRGRVSTAFPSPVRIARTFRVTTLRGRLGHRYLPAPVQHFIEAHGFPAMPRSVAVMVQILVDSKVMSGLIRMKDAEKERDTYPPPLSIYSAPGGLRQDPGRAVESPAGARIRGNGSREMRVLSAFGSRGALPCPIVASDSDRS
jgi:hypothetical protein